MTLLLQGGWPLKIQCKTPVHSSTFFSTFFSFQVFHMTYGKKFLGENSKFQNENLAKKFISSNLQKFLPLTLSVRDLRRAGVSKWALNP